MRVDWGDYVTLTKPRIMSLLLLTGSCGMIAGAHGLPGLGTTTGLVGGLALACGGASALTKLRASRDFGCESTDQRAG